MKQLTIGILAHVDAGKTTLSEGILYLSNTIRKMGRVDNQDSFLDMDEMERQRGITIFSKQAVFDIGQMHVTMLDTPGHVDFSSEMERTLQVLDYAILVISGADGVQGHTLTLWRLLREYNIPTFIFINKMDQNGTEKEKILEELKNRLDDRCVDFSDIFVNGLQNIHFSEMVLEQLAVCEESLLDAYMENGTIDKEEIVDSISNRKVYPCFFGSALKMEGVEELLKGIEIYTKMKTYQSNQGAKVFKISRDEQGNRLTHMKVTGGSLKVKDLVLGEKINQIRIYSGAKYENVNEVMAGNICAVMGLNHSKPGQGIGIEPSSREPVLSPVLMYQIVLPSDCDPYHTFLQLKQLEDEEPQLNLVWNDQLKEIQAQLMGEIQIDILKNLIWKRFHLAIEFGTGNILYKETISKAVEGVGHFEPLRHYAEVHLLMEPGELGSGMQFQTDCSTDLLELNWQRLVLTHLEEREHKGVLVGGAITDMKITLIAGKAHMKHTEGGDFRQATYRAVRQGLMQADSVLLEPYYSFRLELPMEYIGRALSDIETMSGHADMPVIEGNTAIIIGDAPVIQMQGYQKEVVAYTKGIGKLLCLNGGYRPCHNQNVIIDEKKYDPECDLENPTGSVFCAHGAGFVVQWNRVAEYMHVGGRLLTKEKNELESKERQKSTVSSYVDDFVDDYVPKYNPIEYEKNRARIVRAQIEQKEKESHRMELPQYLLVDGYNIIFAWESLRELAEVNLDSARDKLIDIMCNYQGHKGMNLILVFDAYKVKKNVGSEKKHYNIQIVFTKEAETADMYIEKFAHQMGRKYTVTVATSDGVEQIIIRGQGCLLMSATELKEDVELTNHKIREQIQKHNPSNKQYLLANALDKIIN